MNRHKKYNQSGKGKKRSDKYYLLKQKEKIECIFCKESITKKNLTRHQKSKKCKNNRVVRIKIKKNSKFINFFSCNNN